MTYKPVSEIYRAYEVDGVPSSGEHQPIKSDIIAWGTALENFLVASGASLVYQTRTNLFADLARGANTMAWVVNDTTVAYNGIYLKSGASGSGSWTRVADLPYSFARATDVGAGTANAIQATTPFPVSGNQLIILNIFETNTASPVTVSFNGETPLTIKSNSGNDVEVGGLSANMLVTGIISGSTFRLTSDQAIAETLLAALNSALAAQAASEAARDSAITAQAASEAARDAAEGYVQDAFENATTLVFADNSEAIAGTNTAKAMNPATTKAAIDNKAAGYLPLTGGIMTGNLAIGTATVDSNSWVDLRRYGGFNAARIVQDPSGSGALRLIAYNPSDGSQANTLDLPNSPSIPPSVSGSVIITAANFPSQLNQQLNQQFYAGAMLPFAMSSAPTGWLKCNGAAVSRTAYSRLFAAIGTTFGAGDGSTTFNLPDLRGEFVRGWDDGRGIDAGRTFGSAQLDAMQDLEGTFNTTAGFDGDRATGIFTAADSGRGTAGLSTNGRRFTLNLAGAGIRTATETRPRNIALLWCIKW